MNEQQKLNYNRIAEAIAYIKENFKVQPSLDEVFLTLTGRPAEGNNSTDENGTADKNSKTKGELR